MPKIGVIATQRSPADVITLVSFLVVTPTSLTSTGLSIILGPVFRGPARYHVRFVQASSISSRQTLCEPVASAYDYDLQLLVRPALGSTGIWLKV